MRRIMLTLASLIGLVQAADASTAHYWNLFNIEGESNLSAFYATYATLQDMLVDENRTGFGFPDGESSGVFASNVVGSGGAFIAADDVPPVPLPASA